MRCAARRHRAFIAILAVAVVLTLAPGALAATPAQEGYNPPGGNVQANAAATTKTAGSGLPFTGLDLAFVVAVGGGLLLLGGGLRRLSGREGRGG